MSIPPPYTTTLTRDLRHLFTTVALKRRMLKPTGWQKVLTKMRGMQILPNKDRIMKWNIVPGDFIRRIPKKGDPQDNPERYEVLSIDKWQNRVYLKGTKNTDGRAKWLSYANCQLWMGDYPINGIEMPVYAKRVVSTSPVWNWRNQRFEWRRYAVGSVPFMRRYLMERIPWPVEQLPAFHSDPNLYDTLENSVLQMTFQPFTPGTIPSSIENEYISDLFSTGAATSFDAPSFPMEQILKGELANPLSRARRQERWQRQLELLKRSKDEYIQAELKDLQGRRKQDARKEGEFRWIMAVKRYKARIRWVRWVQRGAKARMEQRKQMRELRKTRRMKRLQKMVLKPGKNQAIPEA